MRIVLFSSLKHETIRIHWPTNLVAIRKRCILAKARSHRVATQGNHWPLCRRTIRSLTFVAVSVILDSSIQQCSFWPNSIHHPKVSGTEFVYVWFLWLLIRGCPMVFNSHECRIALRHRIASHTHFHPGQVLNAFGFGDGVHEVESALIQSSIGI